MSIPYVPLYITDFKADTSHLSLHDTGVYFRMIMECWTTPKCTIPNDIEWILDRIVTRHDNIEQVETSVKKVIKLYWTLKRGRLYQKRLKKEWDEVRAKSCKRQKAGQAGGKANSLKYNKKSSSNAKFLLKQPKPNPKPLKNKNKNELVLVPADGTPERKLHDVVVSVYGFDIWRAWFTNSHIKINEGVIYPVNALTKSKIENTFYRALDLSGFTIGEPRKAVAS